MIWTRPKNGRTQNTNESTNLETKNEEDQKLERGGGQGNWRDRSGKGPVDELRGMEM